MSVLQLTAKGRRTGMQGYLAYGISGLGLALAVLAFRLLTAEQKVTRPRQKILRAIYVYMAFSLVLTGAGLSLEVYKAYLGSHPGIERAPSVAHDWSQEMWYDVLKATRKKLFGDAPHQEYVRGELAQGQSRTINIELPQGKCKLYFAMTKPPAQIEATLSSANGVLYSPVGTEPHLSYGRLCAAKTTTDVIAIMQVLMVKSGGSFVSEAYDPPNNARVP